MSPLKSLLKSILPLGTLLFGASTASAVTIGDSGTGVNAVGAYQSGQGGEFYFRPTSAGSTVTNAAYNNAVRNQGVGGTGSFQTFCLERSEYLANGPVTFVVNDEARSGGQNQHLPTGGDGGDIISRGTAWLYSQFAQGILAGYSWAGAARTVSAGLLQNAIWALEDELSPNPAPGANAFFDLAMAHGGEVNASAGLHGVYVLNNRYASGPNSGNRSQDMLYYDGGGASLPVPDGGTSVMLLGLALGGIGILRRYLKG